MLGIPSSRGGDLPEGPPRHRHVAHYHGDVVRFLVVIAALVMLVAESTGAILPLSTLHTITFAVILVIAAGITNPAQAWIHYANLALTIYGVITFGLFAIQQFQLTHDLLAPTYLFAEALALLFLITVYFATKTVRGVMLRPNLA